MNLDPFSGSVIKEGSRTLPRRVCLQLCRPLSQPTPLWSKQVLEIGGIHSGPPSQRPIVPEECCNAGAWNFWNLVPLNSHSAAEELRSAPPARIPRIPESPE